MARTTFDLDPSVLEQLRRRAVHEDKSMGQLASDLLAQQLGAQTVAISAEELEWVESAPHVGTTVRAAIPVHTAG